MSTDPVRTVAVRRFAGLGDILLSTCAAWRYAEATGRTLVLDWRGTWYSSSANVNLFTLLFQPLDTWCGVPVHVTAADERHPRPPTTDAAAEAASGSAACATISAGVDLADEHVRWWGCLAPAHPGRARTAELLRALQPVAHLAEAIDAARNTLLGAGASIGVHLRHGNGGDILNHTRFWLDGLTVHRVLAAIRRAQAVLGANTPVLLATDSAEIQNAVATLVPGVRTLGTPFRPAGEGELHLWPGAAAALDTTFVEMILLAHTTALVRMPPQSYFSAPAAFMKAPAPAELLQRSPQGLEPAVW